MLCNEAQTNTARLRVTQKQQFHHQNMPKALHQV